jgi:hypothetical protein
VIHGIPFFMLCYEKFSLSFIQFIISSFLSFSKRKSGNSIFFIPFPFAAETEKNRTNKKDRDLDILD